jgi:hypothetical protein
MDSSKSQFSSPFRPHSVDERGALAYQVVDDRGALVVSCGLFAHGKEVADLIANALNGATISPLMMRAILYELTTSIERYQKEGDAGAAGLDRALRAANQYLRGPTPRHLALQIPDEAWEESGPKEEDDPEGSDPSLRLLAQATINGTPCHVEAYRVAKDDIQRVDGAYFEQEWNGLCALQDYGAYQTTTIRGREYVLVITPHCD